MTVYFRMRLKITILSYSQKIYSSRKLRLNIKTFSLHLY